MRRILQFLSVLSLVACVSAAGHSTAAVGATAATAPDVRQFLKIRTPASPSLLPDGTMLVRDWPDGVWQLFRVTPGKAADGAPSFDPAVSTRVQLTDFPDGLSGYTLSPDYRWVVLMHARGGNENTQLTLMDLQGPAGANTRTVLDNPPFRPRSTHGSATDPGSSTPPTTRARTTSTSIATTSPTGRRLGFWPRPVPGGRGTSRWTSRGCWSRRSSRRRTAASTN